MGSICPGGHSSEKPGGEYVGLQTQAEHLVSPRSLQDQTHQLISPKSPEKSGPSPPVAPPRVQKATSCDNDSHKGNNSTGGRIPDPSSSESGGKIPDPSSSESGGSIPGSTSSPSRHSPPVSRVSSCSPTRQPSLEGLGSISSVWSRPDKWHQFKIYLSSQSEGEDSDGRPLLLVRYADFLQLFSQLDQAEKQKLGQSELKKRVLDIADSEEDFFGRERGLGVVDGGVRKVVKGRIKAVKDGEEEAGVYVYKEVYPKVLDKLNVLLGVYQNVKLNEAQNTMAKSNNVL